MKNYETLRARRDADFVGCCRRLLRNGEFSGATVAELATKAITMAPKAYYVGFDHAYRMLTRYRRSGRLHSAGQNTKGLWMALMADVEACQRKLGLPLTSALARVLVECHPPEFFISPITGAHIYSRRTRRRRINNFNL